MRNATATSDRECAQKFVCLGLNCSVAEGSGTGTDVIVYVSAIAVMGFVILLLLLLLILLCLKQRKELSATDIGMDNMLSSTSLDTVEVVVSSTDRWEVSRDLYQLGDKLGVRR